MKEDSKYSDLVILSKHGLHIQLGEKELVLRTNSPRTLEAVDDLGLNLK